MALLNTWAHGITVHRFSFPLRVAKILTRSKRSLHRSQRQIGRVKKCWSTTLSIEEKYLFSIIAKKKNMRNGVEQSLILWPSAFHSDVVRSRWRRSVKRGMESYSQDRNRLFRMCTPVIDYHVQVAGIRNDRSFEHDRWRYGIVCTYRLPGISFNSYRRKLITRLSWSPSFSRCPYYVRARTTTKSAHKCIAATAPLR